MNDLDWNLVRAFRATAEAGSLSAASRQLGLSQPTLSRQVAALEEQLAVTLFERVGKRLVLRLQRALVESDLATLNDEFSDIVLDGAIDPTLSSRASSLSQAAVSSTFLRLPQ